jgi:hypothetical protein
MARGKFADMLAVINGYDCVTSKDAVLAWRGLDPRNPMNDPALQDAIDASVGRAVLPEEALQNLLAHPDRAVAASQQPIKIKPLNGAGRIIDIDA